MPVSKKKGTTSPPNASTPPSSLVMLDQHAFHKDLRALAQSAVRTVIEAVMIEELDAFIGVEWGACSPKRKGYRNGSYSRESFDLDRQARGHQRAKTMGKVSSTPRSLDATGAQNRTSPLG
jgi:Transposase, Mutator family